ncbi:hypothetical protein M3182_00090 [Mesobacillus maritimus]|uniref:hypothetical protein n=1 Tax=Mesobacillus maritimus TaxID=1643336 RepID=UPI00203E1453|nr:hypothetical protein [Mesobacillus maritimus]MCM3584149.1 hypothetical protein [Mesobacillus maritimus]MCM3669389.1 hypothetical protein [Mesobacillus maritimus]
MKNFKQWLFVLMASFMFVTVATGCSNAESENEETDTEQTETEEIETEGTEPDEGSEEDE